jgi:carbamoyl-phosphate synthase small subunit
VPADNDAFIVLADGTRFSGRSIGADGVSIGEVVFTTGMTGYQEVLTDPSYAAQIVVMTAPQIGNTGVNDTDVETRRPHVAGFIMRELSPIAASWRAQKSLEEYLKEHGIVALSGIDTRSLTRHIRDRGAQMAAIGRGDAATLHDRAKAAPPMTGRDLTGDVTCAQAYDWDRGNAEWALARTKRTDAHIVAVDFGIKHNILRCFSDLGAKVTVVPATEPAAAILARNPDGVFLSNGPGDPAAVTHGIQTTKDLLGKKPIFGICLGHQILAIALGAESYKLKFGHRGLNQPVKDLATGRVEVTSQNHGFVIDVETLKAPLEVTHLHLNDGTCEGIAHRDAKAFGVQYHPEASAGPHDARYLFDRFLDTLG